MEMAKSSPTKPIPKPVENYQQPKELAPLGGIKEDPNESRGSMGADKMRQETASNEEAKRKAKAE